MVAWLPLLTGASLLGQVLSGKDGGSQTSTNTVTNQMSDEQKKALQMVMNAVSSGSLGGARLGEGYGGNLGSYGMSGLEGAGQNKLMALLQNPASMSSLYNSGKDEITKILSGDTYNPYSDTGVYGGYKKNVMKDLQENSDVLKRNAAFGGDLYSKNTINRLGDLNESAQDQLSGKLAELYDTFAQRRIGAANTALSAGAGETQLLNNIENNKIGMSQQYGALERQLADAKAKDAYNAWQTARNEKIGTTAGMLNSLAGNNAGSSTTTSLTMPTVSPWQRLFDTGTNIGLNLMGNNYYNTGNLWNTGYSMNNLPGFSN
jgi:hypothetical protein